jgi:predicted GNAT superfamily acetyltransferase
MAVEAKYRDQGFGFRMKLAHRQIALERGLKSICWTFDPLQSRNARLNISRLGGDRGAAERPITGTLKASEQSTT